MAVISSDPLVNSSDVSIIIDDNETISVTNLRYSQKINAARIVWRCFCFGFCSFWSYR